LIRAESHIGDVFHANAVRKIKESFISLPFMKMFKVHVKARSMAIAILLLWCAMTSFTYCGLYQRLEAWRQWRWTKLAEGEFDSQLEVFTFTPKEWSSITKFEEGREMEWQGKMYDIASVLVEKERVVVRALSDAYEDSLNQTLLQCSDRPHEDSIPVGWWNVFGVSDLPQICKYDLSSKVASDSQSISFLKKEHAQFCLSVPHLPPCNMI
jgi:hypothetical protein